VDLGLRHLDRLDHEAFDVALVDLSLPDSQGLDTFKQVRAHARSVPVLVLTGLDDESIATRAVGEGAQDYVLKRNLATDILPRAILYALSRQQLLQQLEEQVRAVEASEERYRVVTETAMDAIVTIDEQQQIQYANPAAERLFGYTPPELFQLPANKLLAPGQQGAFDAAISRVQRGGARASPHEALAVTGLRKDGSPIWLEFTLAEMQFGSSKVFTGVFRDVSARKLAEETRLRMIAVTASEERFRSVSETATDAIISADERGIITYFNRSAEKMFGMNLADVAGKPLTVLMPDRFHQAHTAGLARFSSTGEARVIGKVLELEGRRQDGSLFPVELSISNWKTSGQNVFTAIMRDISQRKQTEAELAHQARELAAAYGEMESFSYTVSHDLRAPLRALEGYSRVLLQDYGERLDERGKKSLRRLAAGAKKMDQLLIDILEYSRVGRGQLKIVDTELRGVFEQVLLTMAPVIDERKARVVTALPLPSVKADPDLLGRMVINLVQNALKFVEAGRQPEVDIGADRLGENVRVWVKDNGIGIAPEDQKQIWGVFERLHAGEAYAGTGIGLAIVKRGAERMGGRAGVDSEAGKGSRFWIELPAAGGPVP